MLDSIQKWYSDDAGATIFWLCAQGGTGKSTIARTIATALSLGVNPDDTHEGAGNVFLGASFFFRAQETADKKTPRAVFATIARSLAE